jgi:hypothetical protein
MSTYSSSPEPIAPASPELTIVTVPAIEVSLPASIDGISDGGSQEAEQLFLNELWLSRPPLKRPPPPLAVSRSRTPSGNAVDMLVSSPLSQALFIEEEIALKVHLELGMTRKSDRKDLPFRGRKALEL